MSLVTSTVKSQGPPYSRSGIYPKSRMNLLEKFVYDSYGANGVRIARNPYGGSRLIIDSSLGGSQVNRFKIQKAGANSIKIFWGDWARNGWRFQSQTDGGEDFVTLAGISAASTTYYAWGQLANSGSEDPGLLPTSMTVGVDTTAPTYGSQEDETNDKFFIGTVTTNSAGEVTAGGIEQWHLGNLEDSALQPDAEASSPTSFSVEYRSTAGRKGELSIYQFEDRTVQEDDDALALYVKTTAGGVPSIQYQWPVTLKDRPRNTFDGSPALARMMVEPSSGIPAPGGFLVMAFDWRDFTVDQATLDIGDVNGGDGPLAAQAATMNITSGTLDGSILTIIDWPTNPNQLHEGLTFGIGAATNGVGNVDHSYQYWTLGGTYNGDPDGCWGQSIGRESSPGPSTASLAIDLANSKLHDSIEVLSVDWGNRLLTDSLGNTSAKYGTRQLIYSDALTTSLDWEDSLLNNDVGTETLNWKNRQLNTTAGDWNVTATNHFLIANVDAATAVDTGSLQMQGGFSFKKRAFGSDGTFEVSLVDSSNGRAFYAIDGAQTATLCDGSEAAAFTSPIGGTVLIANATYALDARVGDLNVEVGGYFVGSVPGATIVDVSEVWDRGLFTNIAGWSVIGIRVLPAGGGAPFDMNVLGRVT